MASLAVAMGLNVLIFSFTSPVLFKPLPYSEPDRLLDVSMAPPGQADAKGLVAPALYLLLRDRTRAAFDAVGASDAGRSANLAGDVTGPAARLDGHRISATGLAAPGVKPLLGLLPDATDEQAGAAPTMLLSYPLWQRRCAGRSDVVGETVKVDGQPTQFLGVMPEGFGLLDNSSDAWFTFGFEPAPGQETQHNLRALARLKPGVSMIAAQAAVKVALDEQGKPVADGPVVAREFGLNRYEAISGFDWSPGDRYLTRTAPLWEAVRAEWDARIARGSVTLKAPPDQAQLFGPLFEYADALDSGEQRTTNDIREFVRSAVASYIAPSAQ